jgi:hypothetical protein
MGRRMNEGNLSGVKQDRFRHSDFEYDSADDPHYSHEMSRATINTLGNIGAENRGRRGDQLRNHRFNDDTPFENGRLTNWGNRQGWDKHFRRKSYRPGRQGGAIIGQNDSNYSGLGPKGYQRLDDNIYEDVCAILTSSPDIDASDMEVEVKDGCVFLRGTVSARSIKRQAEIEIENISGVKDVQNLLTIRPGENYVQEH